MKGKQGEASEKLASAHREIQRSVDTLCETRGVLLLAAGYVRSVAVLGYTPDAQELDYVAHALESFGDRLGQEHVDLSHAVSDALPQPTG